MLLSKKHIHVDVGSGIGIDADTHWTIARIDDGDGDGLGLGLGLGMGWMGWSWNRRGHRAVSVGVDVDVAAAMQTPHFEGTPDFEPAKRNGPLPPIVVTSVTRNTQPYPFPAHTVSVGPHRRGPDTGLMWTCHVSVRPPSGPKRRASFQACPASVVELSRAARTPALQAAALPCPS